ncbi:MAG: hypothetical protein ACJ8F2_16065, partial [Xanthobacteraceae bacterium]
MGDGGHKKVSNSLLALSSAAVLAVYSAGYMRTRAAADRFTLQAEARSPIRPSPTSVPEAVASPTPVAASATAPAPVPAAARATSP